MNYYRLMKKYRNDMIETLKRFCVIPSIYDEKTKSPTKPFGEGVDQALKFVGDLGERYGFDVDYCDGYATELTIGKGKTLIGIFAHADVVPISGEWISGPFEPTVRKKNLYARGSSDDKGPFIAAFYAVKALHDAGLLENYRVRLVVGGDEERGSSCLQYYFENLHKEAPTYGFTPDSDFPLVFGEKGIINFRPEFKIDIPNVKKISGGVASNAVCDRCFVEMDKDEAFINYLESKKVKFELKANGVVFLGKSCHGSTPELGVNAALIALKSLGDFYKVEKLSFIANNLSDTSGKKFDGFSHSKLLGDTTYCLGVISYEKGKLQLLINFRYNENVTANVFIKHFDKVFGSKSLIGEESKFLLFDPNSKMVRTLLKAYRRETNDYSEPFTIGGGTYAKHAPNTVAFGALFAHTPSTMHEPNEYIPLKDFFMSSVIYAHAIKLLGELDED